MGFVNFQFLDPGRPNAAKIGRIPIYVGVSGAGALNTLQAFGGTQAIVDEHGEGPLVECASGGLARTGTVFCVRVLASVAGSIGTVTAAPAGAATGTITVAGPPNDRYQAFVQVTKTGTNGTAEFKFSLDNGRTYSPSILVPSGGTYVVPNTGMTLTFVPGAGGVFFETGDVHSFESVAPHYGATEVAAAITAIKESGQYPGAGIVFSGNPADASAGAVLYSAIEAQMQALPTGYVYAFALMNAGNDTPANILSAFAATSGTRTLACVGTTDSKSSKPYMGYAAPQVPFVNNIAEESIRRLISESMGRIARGDMRGVTGISYNEEVSGLLRGKGFVTAMTSVGDPGFYIYAAEIHSQAGSDYDELERRRVMDEACFVAYTGLKRFRGATLRANDDGTGTIYEPDAIMIEEHVTALLKAALLKPLNAEGNPGHVSGLSITVDRSADIATDKIVQASIAIVPVVNAKQMSVAIGFAVSTGGN